MAPLKGYAQLIPTKMDKTCQQLLVDHRTNHLITVVPDSDTDITLWGPEIDKSIDTVPAGHFLTPVRFDDTNSLHCTKNKVTGDTVLAIADGENCIYLLTTGDDDENRYIYSKTWDESASPPKYKSAKRIKTRPFRGYDDNSAKDIATTENGALWCLNYDSNHGIEIEMYDVLETVTVPSLLPLTYEEPGTLPEMNASAITHVSSDEEESKNDGEGSLLSSDPRDESKDEREIWTFATPPDRARRGVLKLQF